MAFDFPSSPVEGQVYRPANATNWIYRTGEWIRMRGYALPYNRIMNPAFQISQQNGNTVSPAGGAFGYYIADGWRLVGASGLVNASMQSGRTAFISPNGSKYAVYLMCTTANAAPGASDIVSLRATIEGSKVADFNWGTAAARDVVIRFWVQATVAGTYTVRVGDYSGGRSYLIPYTILATQLGKWLKQEFSVPGDIAGSWPKGNVGGMRIEFTLVVGTSQDGVAYTWGANNFYGVIGMSNFCATQDNLIYIADVGLYLDPEKTGVAPPFQHPHVEDDMLNCQRFWYKSFGQRGVISSATQGWRLATIHPVPMAVVPTIALVGTTLRLYDAAAAVNISSIAAAGYPADPSEYLALFTATSPGTHVLGRPACVLVDGQEAEYIAVSGRI